MRPGRCCWVAGALLTAWLLAAAHPAEAWWGLGEGPQVKTETAPFDPVDFQNVIAQGVAQHHRYMHRKAKDIIMGAVKKHPEEAGSVVALLFEEAKQLLSEEDEVGARGILETTLAVAQIQNDAETIYNIANLFLQAGAPEQALTGFRAVQALLPELASAYHQIGLTYSKMNKLDDAFESYNRAIELLPTYSITYNNIGVLLAKQGRTREALSHYHAALSLDPDYNDARNNVHAAEENLKDEEREASLSMLEDETSLEGAEAREFLSHVQVEGASDVNVTTALRKLISNAQARRRNSPPGVVDVALQLAVGEAVPSVIRSPDAAALFDLAMILMDLSSFEAAAEVFLRVSQLRPRSGVAQHQLALALAKADDYEGSLAAYQSAISRDPTLAVSHNNMGVILVKLDMVSRAQEHYERALQLDPQYLDAQVSGIPAVAPG